MGRMKKSPPLARMPEDGKNQCVKENEQRRTFRQQTETEKYPHVTFFFMTFSYYIVG